MIMYMCLVTTRMVINTYVYSDDVFNAYDKHTLFTTDDVYKPYHRVKQTNVVDISLVIKDDVHKYIVGL